MTLLSRLPGWLVGLVILLAIACLLALGACAPKTAPPVFSLALPALPQPPPSPEDPVATGSACEGGPMLPGAAVPGASVVRGEAVATCFGQVVTNADVYGWMAAEDDAAYWRDLAELQHDYRAGDRALCEERYAAEWSYGQEVRRDNRALRWAGYGLGVGGLVVGALIGVAAAQVAQ